MTCRSSGLSCLIKLVQPFERAAAIERLLFAGGRGERFQAVIERDDARRVGPRPKHLRDRRVVSDPVDPGPKGASAVESSKAPPERDMNLLQQVATFVRVAFVRPRQPLQRRAERRGGLGIQLLAIAGPARINHSFQVVAWRRGS